MFYQELEKNKQIYLLCSINRPVKNV